MGRVECSGDDGWERKKGASQAMPPVAVLCVLDGKQGCDMVAKWIGAERGRRGRPVGAPACGGSVEHCLTLDGCAGAGLQGAGLVQHGRQTVVGGGGACRSGDRAEGEEQGDEESFLHVAGFPCAMDRLTVRRPSADEAKLPKPGFPVCSAGNRGAKLVAGRQDACGFGRGCRYSLEALARPGTRASKVCAAISVPVRV